MPRVPLRLAVSLLVALIAPGALMPPARAQAIPAASHAAGPGGFWRGDLQAMGRTIPLEFFFQRETSGSWGGKVTLVGGPSFPFDDVGLSGNTLTAHSASHDVTFKGDVAADGRTIKGQWQQRGMSFALTMALRDGPTVVRRPQDPVPPYPYREEEVRYRNDTAGITLGGTLTLPPGPGPFPAVLLITGSGAQDRDETISAHHPFRVIADDLTRRGLAVLRVDDRGVGATGGSTDASTTADFVTDVESGLRFLEGRADIDRAHLGLIGHSEGGMIAPWVASQDPRVAFIVLLAGPALSGEAIIRLQSEIIMRRAGSDERQVRAAAEVQRQALAIAKGTAPRDQAAEALRRLFAAQPRPAADPQPEATRRATEAEITSMLSPWYRYFLAFDPAPYLKKVHCPVLALNGEHDVQVPCKENLAPMQALLQQAGNSDVTIRSFPRLNHLFQTSATGMPDEYGQLEETIAPAVLEVMGQWVTAHAKAASR